MYTSLCSFSQKKREKEERKRKKKRKEKMENATFPTFTRTQGEDANNFLDKLEIACFISTQDDNASRVWIFPLLLKMEARLCNNALP